MEHIKCIMKGCTNHQDQGEFRGDLCLPCYNNVTTGKIGKGSTVLHDMQKRNDKLKEKLKKTAKKLTENVLLTLKKPSPSVHLLCANNLLIADQILDFIIAEYKKGDE